MTSTIFFIIFFIIYFIIDILLAEPIYCDSANPLDLYSKNLKELRDETNSSPELKIQTSTLDEQAFIETVIPNKLKSLEDSIYRVHSEPKFQEECLNAGIEKAKLFLARIASNQVDGVEHISIDLYSHDSFSNSISEGIFGLSLLVFAQYFLLLKKAGLLTLILPVLIISYRNLLENTQNWVLSYKYSKINFNSKINFYSTKNIYLSLRKSSISIIKKIIQKFSSRFKLTNVKPLKLGWGGHYNISTILPKISYEKNILNMTSPNRSMELQVFPYASIPNYTNVTIIDLHIFVIRGFSSVAEAAAFFKVKNHNIIRYIDDQRFIDNRYGFLGRDVDNIREPQVRSRRFITRLTKHLDYSRRGSILSVYNLRDRTVKAMTGQQFRGDYPFTITKLTVDNLSEKIHLGKYYIVGWHHNITVDFHIYWLNRNEIQSLPFIRTIQNLLGPNSLNSLVNRSLISRIGVTTYNDIDVQTRYHLASEALCQAGHMTRNHESYVPPVLGSYLRERLITVIDVMSRECKLYDNIDIASLSIQINPVIIQNYVNKRFVYNSQYMFYRGYFLSYKRVYVVLDEDDFFTKLTE